MHKILDPDTFNLLRFCAGCLAILGAGAYLSDYAWPALRRRIRAGFDRTPRSARRDFARNDWRQPICHHCGQAVPSMLTRQAD